MLSYCPFTKTVLKFFSMLIPSLLFSARGSPLFESKIKGAVSKTRPPGESSATFNVPQSPLTSPVAIICNKAKRGNFFFCSSVKSRGILLAIPCAITFSRVLSLRLSNASWAFAAGYSQSILLLNKLLGQILLHLSFLLPLLFYNTPLVLHTYPKCVYEVLPYALCYIPEC